MAQIITFPRSSPYAPVRARTGRRHRVRMRIVDRLQPEEARWFSQFAIQRAGSFLSLRGFTDAAARRQRWHTFGIGRTRLLRRFLNDIGALVSEGRVLVEVDGVPVRVKGTVAA
jgi:hypothetical protein